MRRKRLLIVLVGCFLAMVPYLINSLSAADLTDKRIKVKTCIGSSSRICMSIKETTKDGSTTEKEVYGIYIEGEISMPSSDSLN